MLIHAKFSLIFIYLSLLNCQDIGNQNGLLAKTAAAKKIVPPMPSERFNFVELPLGQAQLATKLSQTELLRLQHQLWDAGVPLTPATFYPLPTDREKSFNQTRWQEFKSNFKPEQQVVLDKIMNGVEHLTYDELFRGMASLLQKFPDLVQDDYAVGITPNKSSHWLASLAAPHLQKHLPKEAFKPLIDTILNIGTENKLIKKIEDVRARHFVIFDDGSYSGQQLAMTTGVILRSFSQCRVTLFVPFISEMAKKTIEDEAILGGSTEKVVTLVTTSRRIKPLFAAVSEAEFRKIRLFGTNKHAALLMLSLPAWKVPDGVSVPDFLIAAKVSSGKIKEIDGYGSITGYSGAEKPDCNKPDIYCFFEPIIAPYKNIVIAR